MMKNERLLKIISSTHTSEKTTTGTDKRNEITLCVIDDAQKTEIKDAVELLFSVKVKSVRIVNVKKKKRMFKGYEGYKKAWKKAYVTLHADQKIDSLMTQ